MKEYSLLAVFSVLFAVSADALLKTKLLKQGFFWLFILAILLFKIIVNGYLTGTNIVMYNPKFFMNTRLGSIPLEDFLFGFSMVALTVIFWEYFKRRKK